MAKTKANRQGSWSVDAYSDSSESEKSISVVTSSDEEPSPKKTNRNPALTRKSRRARDPEPEARPSRSKMGRKNSRRIPEKDKKIRKSGFGTSSDESSSYRYNIDDSLAEEDQPTRRGAKGKKPHFEFGDPGRSKRQKEVDDDTDSKLDENDEDDSWMNSPPQKTTTKLDKYVKQSPRDGPAADVENQSSESSSSSTSSGFIRQLNELRQSRGLNPQQSFSVNKDGTRNSFSVNNDSTRNSSNVPKDGIRNPNYNDTQETNTDDSVDEKEDDQSDYDKPIPERRPFLTRERKIITCLTLSLCCFCLLAALGIGIGIGLASRSEEHAAPPPPPPSKLSQAPSTQPPSADPDAELLQLLSDSSFDQGVALSTQGTPQRSAYEWLSRNAELPNYTTEVKLARYALATFYFSTNGPSTWAEKIRNDGWMTDAPECEWASTARNQCTGTTYSSLTLDFVGVSGQIPPELAYLTGLTRLSLRSEGIGSPSIAGSLPSTIGQLQNLQTIRLNENKIGGTLPTSIGRLTNVRVFLMSGNSLEGSIPSEIGRTMGNTFNFDRNRLTGRLPVELFRMGTLTALNFEDNLISGQIPRQIGMNPSLNSINFASNRLTGTIPTEFGRLVTVRSGINLSNNVLSGSLPSELGSLVDMQNLLLNNNRLVGRVPGEYDTIKDMRLLRIDGNQLSGEMPLNVCDSFTDRTISFADCGTKSFQCSCCTFCCSGQLCACNVDDESICTKGFLGLESMKLDQETSGLYYSETEEDEQTVLRDSSRRRILGSLPY